MNIKPLFDKVVLKAAEKETTTKGGLILASSAQEKPDMFEVVAVGRGAYRDGALIPMSVKPGDKVLLSKYSGNRVKLDGVEYTIVGQEEILAVVE